MRWLLLAALLGTACAAARLIYSIFRLDIAHPLIKTLEVISRGALELQVEDTAATLSPSVSSRFPPRCAALNLSPPRNRTRLENVVGSARIVGSYQWTSMGPGVRKVTLRVAVGSARNGRLPAPESCTDRVRGALFGGALVIAAETNTLAYKHTTPGSAFDVLVSALVPCDAPAEMHVYIGLEWDDWSVSDVPYNYSQVYRNHLQTNGECQPGPVHANESQNLLIDPKPIAVLQCITAPPPRPQCNASRDLDIFTGAYYVSSPAMVHAQSGSLAPNQIKEAALESAAWRYARSSPVRWQP